MKTVKKWTLMIMGLIFIHNLNAQTVIQMERNSGVSIIPCKVNGLDLSFIFDTGAADVTISLTEANFMIKNGFMSYKDIIGTSNYSDANGDISEGINIIIREIDIQGLKLYNVKASIIKNLNAPLLLGQSAISKLGPIQLDLALNTLTIANKVTSYDFSKNIEINEVTKLNKNIILTPIEQGKKLVYCERYKSAKDVFQKILSTDPNNDEATYWLGQCMILPDDRSSKDIADAKALYQTKLAANNSNLLIAGIGHIELLEGKIQDARNHFEAAISLTQGKNITVLNAIGFANGNPDAKNGDAMYAIEKLNQAKAIKKFNDPDVLVNLGDAYRKAGDGGNAILSYQAALAINPNYARANYRIGRIYQSQGRSQESIFMEYYDKAIASDPTFAPVYLTLFSFNYETNVTKAAEYFDKWLANTDEDEKSCYYRASLKFAQGLFMEAVSKCDECIAAGGANPYPSLFGLKANAYSKLKDSMKVIECYAEYFKRQASDKVVSADYLEYAKNLLKIPGNEAEAGLFIEKAVAIDSIEKNKVDYLKSVAQIYEGQKKYRNAAQWYMKVLAIKKNPGKIDLYNAGYNFFRGGGYDSSILVFTNYTEKFPEDIFGNYMIAKSNAAIDTSGTLGLAVPFYIKAIEIGEKEADKTKVKDKLMGSYQYLIEYYYNKMKDQANALIYADKALLLDPNDTQMINNRDFISKNDPKAAPKKPATNKQATKP